MEEAFGTLKQNNLNNVDNLTKWIKESKLIEETNEAEEETKKLFDNVKDKQDVQIGEFKGVVSKLAADNNKTMEQVSKMLTDAVPKLQQAVTAAASAFKNALGN